MIRRIILAASLLLPLAAQARVNLATAPISRMDLPWWRAHFTQTNALAKADPQARVIWLGDSISYYWQRTGDHGYDNVLPVWQHYYAPYHALDFGFIGDTTANLIWRLDHGEVSGLHPKLAIILIGANNFGLVHWDAAMTIPGIEAVVADTRRDLPATHILLLGVLPSVRSPWVDRQTRLTNAALARYYQKNPAVTFINVAPVLTHDGVTDPGLYVDPRMTPPRPALHPDATGMARIAAYIQPAVVRYAH
ncbi:MAG: GDSL-type esterase/lipase family protein [Acidocella sp.]|nr:GDSL-type esterase/lipase family protein [Acidocella sp.]